MFFPILVLSWMLKSSTADKFQITTEEITSGQVKFGIVYSMIPHPSDPALLVINDQYSLWTFNPVKNVKSLIAGSTEPGYAEGVGVSARFKDLPGSAPFNDTTVISTDIFNSCIRLVGLYTRLTETYAGKCSAAGDQDGSRLSSKFVYPYGIIRVGIDFYVCDTNYKKGTIRKISNDAVTTLISSLVHPRKISTYGMKLFYSYYHGIGEFNLSIIPKCKNLTGQSSQGFINGPLGSAKFDHPRDIIPLTVNILLVADADNGALRLIDVNSSTVSTIILNMTSNPESLVVYNGKIFVGLNDGRILGFAANQIQGLGELIGCDSDQNLTISVSQYSALFQPGIVISNSVICTNCPSVQNLTIGVHHFSYKFKNKRDEILNFCNQTVRVNIEIGKPICPGNMTVTLPVGDKCTNFSLPQPDTNGTRLECISCSPDHLLNEGSHQITFIYQDRLQKGIISCSYRVEVLKPASPFCSNETKHVYLKRNQSSTEGFKYGDLELRLRAGITEIGTAARCYHTYIVNEWNAIERRAVLQAEYEVDCSSLSKQSYPVIESYAKQHTHYLRQLCHDCKVNRSEPVDQCSDGKVLITWETDFIEDQKTLPADMKKKIEHILIKFQNRDPIMDISVIDTDTKSRFVSPVRQKSGYLKVIIRTRCLEDGYVYNVLSGLCKELKVTSSAALTTSAASQTQDSKLILYNVMLGVLGFVIAVLLAVITILALKIRTFQALEQPSQPESALALHTISSSNRRPLPSTRGLSNSEQIRKLNPIGEQSDTISGGQAINTSPYERLPDRSKAADERTYEALNTTATYLNFPEPPAFEVAGEGNLMQSDASAYTVIQ